MPLVEHCIIVAIDTEAWTSNTDEMTEIGIVIAKYEDGNELHAHVGDYAENVLKKMGYYHLRIWENAHLKTNAPWMRGPEGNRFGQTRFVKFAEARAVLDEILNQPIVSSNADLARMKRPVILVGHALEHDEENVEKSGLSYDFNRHGTVVKRIDTQRLVQELAAWVHPNCANNKVGLDTLCEEVFNFAHKDPHTALNDAARTMICAVNLALRNWRSSYKVEKTMQEVAFEIEKHSRDNFKSNWGTVLCCTRCGGRDHNNDRGQCKASVYCLACERFDQITYAPRVIDKAKHIRSHTEQFCVHVAEFNGWKRRVVDARRKLNHLPPGPPAGSHPPSSWRGIWPMSTPGDVLVPERPVTPVNEWLSLPPDGLPAGSGQEPDVKVVTFQSNARERATKSRMARKGVMKPTTETKDAWDPEDTWNGNAW